jgi:hypothetical protein
VQSETSDGELITRYQLGDLSEPEQESVEQRLLADEAFCEQALAIENELAYDYAAGLLTPREREQFEKRFLTSAEDRAKLEMAGTILATIDEAREKKAAERSSINDSPGLIESFRLWMRAQRPIIQYSLSFAVLLLVVGAGLLIFRLVRSRNGEQIAQSNPPPSLTASPLPQLNASPITATPAASASPKPSIPLETPAELRPVIALVLSPGLSRSGGEEPKRVTISKDEALRLQLIVKAEGDYQSYSAVLRTVEGKQVFSQRRLHLTTNNSQRLITLEIPAKSVPPGDYELTLSGVGKSGVSEEIADYYFTWVKK